MQTMLQTMLKAYTYHFCICIIFYKIACLEYADNLKDLCGNLPFIK